MEPLTVTAEVPCNGCTACCRFGLIFLRPDRGDVVEDYQTRLVVNPATDREELALARKPEGGCVYLDETGCSIHGHAPAVCAEFDCRRFYLSLNREQRRRYATGGEVHRAVLEAGRQRLRTLEEFAE